MESRIEQQLSQLAEPHKKILEPIREDVALTLEILLGNSVIGLKKVVEYATTNPGTPWPRLEVYKNIADKITEELPEQMKDYLPDDRKTKESVKQLSENPETVAKLKEIFQQNVEYVMDSMRTAHMQEQGKNQGAQSR